MKFSITAFLLCLFLDHRWTNSKQYPGYKTCLKCGTRRKF
jgi:hypothetical protein